MCLPASLASRVYLWVPLITLVLSANSRGQAQAPPPTQQAQGPRWPGFRGDGSGIASGSGLPVDWSPTSGVAWKAAIPGYGQSSPLIWGDRVFVTSTDGPFQEQCLIHAWSLATGKPLWSKTASASEKAENYFRNSRSAPTGVVDQHSVFCFFPGGDLIALDHNGTIRWSVPMLEQMEPIENERGIASSLAQTDDKIFVLIDHHGPSALIAINKDDGSIAWRADRGKRVPSWSSPVVTRYKDTDLVIASSADTVDAYDASTGKSLWQLEGLQGNHIPSASVSGSRIHIGSSTMYGGASDPDEVAGSNCCLELTERDGKIGYELQWNAEKANSYYSTPLAFDRYVYYVNKVGVLYCINAKTGEQLFAKRIGNPCWASAIGTVDSQGQKRVYFVMTNGFTVVLRPGDTYDQISRNQLWSASEMADVAATAAEQRKANQVPAEQAKPKSGPEKVFAGLPEKQLHQMFSYRDPTVYAAAAAGDSLLIRTGQHLYCVRKP